MRPFPAAVLSIGSELTAGRSPDTNAAFLARRIRGLGGRITETRAVPDDLPAIAGALVALSAGCRLLAVTGGLGPTADDLTREALALAAGAPLVLHPPSLRRITARFRSLGRPMSPNNRRQALLPRGAQALSNPLGTAPGIRMRLGRCRVVAMPGVPREMAPMWAQEERRLRPALGGAPVRTLLLHCIGLPESEVDRRIGDLMRPGRPAEVGVTVRGGVVTVSISAPGGGGARRALSADAAAVRQRLGGHLFGAGRDTLPGVLLRRLRRRRQTLALAESATGGLIAHLLTDVPGCSGSLLEGRVVYGPAAKRRLGLPAALLRRHGAVSAEVTEALARAVRKSARADWGLALTGVAGPAGGTRETPVGTVFATLAWRAGAETRRWRFPGDRATVKRRAALSALDLLRRRLGR